ncbi:MAG: S9 family peptidase [Rubrivivax sp.]|nr:MAG: S9 family peptidase [Rubrivivax sp.]
MTERRPFEPEDLQLEQRITEVHILPDHMLALCSVKSLDTEQDDDVSTLWTYDLESGEARRFTPGTAKDKGARWSPDGREIAFLSDRDDKDGAGISQVYVMPHDGGEARQLTHLARGAMQIYWRPQGDRLLVTGMVTVDPDERAAGCDRDDGATARMPDSHKPQVVWRLPYKLDGSGYVLDSRIHLFLIDRDSGEATQLTRGDFEVQAAAWAPDGRRVCFVRTRDPGDPEKGEGEAHCTDVWLLPIGDDAQPGEAKRLTLAQANCSSPSWSPDGRWIAFVGAEDDGDAQMRLWLIDVERGDVKPLGADSIEAMGHLHWRRDSTELAFIQVDRGLQQVSAITVPEGQDRCVVRCEQHVDYLSACARKLVYTCESAKKPLELFCTDWQDGELRQVSHLNRWFQDERTAPEVGWRKFEVPDGQGGQEGIDGWLMRPPGKPGKPGPLLIDAHGGPASYALLSFNLHPYWQVLCSRGWSVLALNAVGSSSYGREFSERLRGHWGEMDLPQIMAAVEQLRRDGIADDRLAITGSSYGGYLSAYAVSRCHDFRVAVVCAPVANMESHFGTSDSGYFADPYSTSGDPSEQRELLARLSPMTKIEDVRTPTLFLQGTDDERCPRGQSEELFVRLRRAGGAPTEMVLYPGGSHHVFGEGKPSHRLDIQHRIVDWLERWVEVSHAR